MSEKEQALGGRGTGFLAIQLVLRFSRRRPSLGILQYEWKMLQELL